MHHTNLVHVLGRLTLRPPKPAPRVALGPKRKQVQSPPRLSRREGPTAQYFSVGVPESAQLDRLTTEAFDFVLQLVQELGGTSVDLTLFQKWNYYLQFVSSGTVYIAGPAEIAVCLQESVDRQPWPAPKIEENRAVSVMLVVER